MKGGYSYSEKGAEDLPVALKVPGPGPFGNRRLWESRTRALPTLRTRLHRCPATATATAGGTSQSKTPRATSAFAGSASTGSSVSQLKLQTTIPFELGLAGLPSPRALSGGRLQSRWPWRLCDALSRGCQSSLRAGQSLAGLSHPWPWVHSPFPTPGSPAATRRLAGPPLPPLPSPGWPCHRVGRVLSYSSAPVPSSDLFPTHRAGFTEGAEHGLHGPASEQPARARSRPSAQPPAARRTEPLGPARAAASIGGGPPEPAPGAQR